jgi:hypothetical protein
MNTTTAAEIEDLRADVIEGLKAAEFQAEQRYLDAIMNSDLPTARAAAANWIYAAEALTEYIATHRSAPSQGPPITRRLLAAADRDDRRQDLGKEPAVNVVRLVVGRQG